MSGENSWKSETEPSPDTARQYHLPSVTISQHVISDIDYLQTLGESLQYGSLVGHFEEMHGLVISGADDYDETRFEEQGKYANLQKDEANSELRDPPSPTLVGFWFNKTPEELLRALSVGGTWINEFLTFDDKYFFLVVGLPSTIGFFSHLGGSEPEAARITFFSPKSASSSHQSPSGTPSMSPCAPLPPPSVQPDAPAGPWDSAALSAVLRERLLESVSPSVICNRGNVTARLPDIGVSLTVTVPPYRSPLVVTLTAAGMGDSPALRPVLVESASQAVATSEKLLSVLIPDMSSRIQTVAHLRSAWRDAEASGVKFRAHSSVDSFSIFSTHGWTQVTFLQQSVEARVAVFTENTETLLEIPSSDQDAQHVAAWLMESVSEAMFSERAPACFFSSAAELWYRELACAVMAEVQILAPAARGTLTDGLAVSLGDIVCNLFLSAQDASQSDTLTWPFKAHISTPLGRLGVVMMLSELKSAFSSLCQHVLVGQEHKECSSVTFTPAPIVAPGPPRTASFTDSERLLQMLEALIRSVSDISELSAMFFLHAHSVGFAVSILRDLGVIRVSGDQGELQCSLDGELRGVAEDILKWVSRSLEGMGQVPSGALEEVSRDIVQHVIEEFRAKRRVAEESGQSSDKFTEFFLSERAVRLFSDGLPEFPVVFLQIPEQDIAGKVGPLPAEEIATVIVEFLVMKIKPLPTFREVRDQVVSVCNHSLDGTGFVLSAGEESEHALRCDGYGKTFEFSLQGKTIRHTRVLVRQSSADEEHALGEFAPHEISDALLSFLEEKLAQLNMIEPSVARAIDAESVHDPRCRIAVDAVGAGFINVRGSRGAADEEASEDAELSFKVWLSRMGPRYVALIDENNSTVISASAEGLGEALFAALRDLIYGPPALPEQGAASTPTPAPENEARAEEKEMTVESEHSSDKLAWDEKPTRPPSEHRSRSHLGIDSFEALFRNSVCDIITESFRFSGLPDAAFRLGQASANSNQFTLEVGRFAAVVELSSPETENLPKIGARICPARQREALDTDGVSDGLLPAQNLSRHFDIGPGLPVPFLAFRLLLWVYSGQRLWISAFRHVVSALYAALGEQMHFAFKIPTFDALCFGARDRRWCIEFIGGSPVRPRVTISGEGGAETISCSLKGLADRAAALVGIGQDAASLQVLEASSAPAAGDAHGPRPAAREIAELVPLEMKGGQPLAARATHSDGGPEGVRDALLELLRKCFAAQPVKLAASKTNSHILLLSTTSEKFRAVLSGSARAPTARVESYHTKLRVKIDGEASLESLARKVAVVVQSVKNPQPYFSDAPSWPSFQQASEAVEIRRGSITEYDACASLSRFIRSLAGPDTQVEVVTPAAPTRVSFETCGGQRLSWSIEFDNMSEKWRLVVLQAAPRGAWSPLESRAGETFHTLLETAERLYERLCARQ
eukprot:gnl/Chilomastix_cuspidata/5081.p1 GENE.gnl/Chilomastix_cuspidata/5081~~gnl/Chilomastix_cuspidata/5081.p1  ORF type:complete len:1426 (-),score=380.81 gnl/Chilomastix_cuspidata/5081:585-4862(-)